MNSIALTKLSADSSRSNSLERQDGQDRLGVESRGSESGSSDQNDRILSESRSERCTRFSLTGDVLEGDSGREGSRAEPRSRIEETSVECPCGSSRRRSTDAETDVFRKPQSQLVPTAGFASASTLESREDRSGSSGGDRRQSALEALWRESSRGRQRHCRRDPVSTAATIDVYRSDRGTYFGGLQTCGYITCPVCGPKIRETERERVARTVAAHLEAGGFVYLFLLTVSHGPFDHLTDILDALDAGRSAAIGGNGGSRWARDRKRYGIIGTCWHREEMHGLNGWHPHVHGLLFTDRELTEKEVEDLQSRIFGRHRDAIKSKGYTASSSLNEIQVVRDPESVAGYLTKQRGTPDRISAELTRGDLKKGKGVTPGALIERFAERGDMADLNLFRDYETASEGRHWRYLSPSLTKLYGVNSEADAIDDQPEEDIATAEEKDRVDAQDDVGGQLVMQIPPVTWRAIRSRLGEVSRLRRLVHVGAFEDAHQLVQEAARSAARRAGDREAGRRHRERSRAPS